MFPRKVNSLTIMDIAPVSYSAMELSTVTSTVDFLKSSISLLQSASSKEAALEIIGSFTTDPALTAFLMSNLQQSPDRRAFMWKYNVEELCSSLSNILDFPNFESQYTRPTLVLKAGKSDFVKTKHVEAIQKHFPVYTLATLRDCGHWLHSEKPSETADAVSLFVKKVMSMC
jgi:esterase